MIYRHFQGTLGPGFGYTIAVSLESFQERMWERITYFKMEDDKLQEPNHASIIRMQANGIAFPVLRTPYVP